MAGQRHGHGTVLRINVSPVQLVSRNFVRTVADTFEETGSDARSVCLEVTEHAVVQDLETARKTFAALKEVGVQVAIDDFGSGYAVVTPEIVAGGHPQDRAGFVTDLGNDAGDLAIVKAIIGFAESFVCNSSPKAWRPGLPH